MSEQTPLSGWHTRTTSPAPTPNPPLQPVTKPAATTPSQSSIPSTLAPLKPSASIPKDIQENNQDRFLHCLANNDELDKIWSFIVEYLNQTNPTDIHFSDGYISLRIHKEIDPWIRLREETYKALILRSMPEANQKELEEKGQTDYSIQSLGRRFRANAYKTLSGITAAYRPLRNEALKWQNNNLPETVIQRLKQATSGLILVTGPTGSGKSTTICSLIEYLNETRKQHIITIENPIEYVFSRKKCLIHQRQIGEDTESFTEGLRAAMRQDPDIIYIGEIRDPETAETALNAAETGHLVMATLHTTRVYQTISRLLSMVPEERLKEYRTVLSNTINMVICQRLLPRKNGGLFPAREIMFSTVAMGNLIRTGNEKQINHYMKTGYKEGMLEWNRMLKEAQEANLITLETREKYEEKDDI